LKEESVPLLDPYSSGGEEKEKRRGSGGGLIELEGELGTETRSI
jgi:hypothetical protein